MISGYRKNKFAREISRVTGWTLEESHLAYYAMTRVLYGMLLSRRAFHIPNVGSFVFKARNARRVPPRTLPNVKGNLGPRLMPETFHKKRIYVRFKASAKFNNELNANPHPKDPEPSRRPRKRSQGPVPGV